MFLLQDTEEAVALQLLQLHLQHNHPAAPPLHEGEKREKVGRFQSFKRQCRKLSKRKRRESAPALFFLSSGDEEVGESELAAAGEVEKELPVSGTGHQY